MLYGREWTESFRAAVITAWETPLAELFLRNGFPPAEAARRARLGLAVTRGLLLDLLLCCTTGIDDRSAVDDAAELLGEVLSRSGP